MHSYVLWYGGLLDEAASECEKTRSLDAGTTDLASCFYVFMALGRYERAREYLQLQSGTEYEKVSEVEILLREGKQDQALQQLKSLPATPALYGRQLLEPCVEHRRVAEAEAVAVQRMRLGVMANDDPLLKYSLGAWDSLCDQPDHAYRELRQAITQSYCAYPQMETDPLLARVRGKPEYSQLRLLGLACQQQLLGHRKKRSSE